jgi:hypothetical protein
MGCEAASLGKWFQTFRRNVSPSSSKFQVLNKELEARP